MFSKHVSWNALGIMVVYTAHPPFSYGSHFVFFHKTVKLITQKVFELQTFEGYRWNRLCELYLNNFKKFKSGLNWLSYDKNQLNLILILLKKYLSYRNLKVTTKIASVSSSWIIFKNSNPVKTG